MHVRLLLAVMLPLAPVRAQVQLFTPNVIVDVPTAPTPFRRDGHMNLAYEVHVTNMGASVLLIQRAEVLDRRDSVVAVFDSTTLASMVARPVPALKLVDPTMIESGRRAVLFIWLKLPAGAPVPSSFRHRIAFRAIGPQNFATNVVVAGETTPARQWAPVLGSPLRGGPWVARFSGNGDAHRRTVMSVNGRPLLAQRFAIDFGKLGPDGRQFKPNGKTNADVYGHADDILAVADGRVALVADGMKENDPNLPQPAPTTVSSAFGNQVVIEVGRGVFASYSHLLPGIPVKPGDRVKKGQVIGKVGNTGSSTAPHLHFQLMTDSSLAGADGYPYMFDQFTIMGLETREQFRSLEWHPDPAVAPRVVRGEMTPNGAVVRFDE